ncbi:MAG: hypothetical protein ACI9KE_006343 [Polyangiales bacterium]|jgi:hypothetical protein
MNRSLLIALCSIVAIIGCGDTSEEAPAQAASSPAEAPTTPVAEPEAPAIPLEPAADGTYSCTEGNYTIAGIYAGPADVADLNGPLITASGTCHLSVTTSTVFGDPAIKVEGSAQVTSSAVSYNATPEGAAAPIHLEGSATFTMTGGSSHARTDDSPCAYIGEGTTLTVESGMCSSGTLANAGGTFTDNGGSYWHR